MKEIWQRIEVWLSENAPEVLGTLQQGATNEQIAELEQGIGVQLPEDVRESFRIHNGQIDYSFGFIHAVELLSLTRVWQEWSVWKELRDNGTFETFTSEPQQEIKGDWWNECWIPLTYDGSGNHHCLDMAPTAAGTPGQIITMWHDSGDREVVAGSYRIWLENFAADLENGVYVYAEDYEGLVRADELEDETEG